MASLIKNKLKSLNLRAQKSKGQNFLYDKEAIYSIVEFGEPEGRVVEIGPGLGALTEILLEKVDNLEVIELEEKFCTELSSKFGSRLTIYNEDATKFFPEGENIVAFGNLPYSRSTEIILHLLANRTALKRGTFLLQKEFSERLAARPNTKAYGSLSIAVQVWCDTRLGPIISGDKFHPKANVMSQVIRLDFRKEPKIIIPKNFERIVRASFNQRRKKLFNSLLSSGYERSVIETALNKAEIDGSRRAETLTIEEFGRLALGFLRE
jgi:16S rRNA (adenine1518-N6/adenine1519-N6)-dimethyltransferase